MNHKRPGTSGGRNGNATTGEERCQIGRVIQELRQRLIDTSKRNPLVNFRHPTRSKRMIRVIDEVPALTFDKLTAGTPLRFTPVPDPELHPADENTPEFKKHLAEARKTDPLYLEAIATADPRIKPTANYEIERPLRDRLRAKLEMPAWTRIDNPQDQARLLGIPTDYELPLSSTEPRHKEKRLQVLMFDEEMADLLHDLSRTADGILDDSGVWVLHAAFGFLEWSETRESQETHLAPLLTLPVRITERVVDYKYHYFLETSDEDPVANRSIAKKLSEEFHFTLPALEDFTAQEGGDIDLAAWLKAIDKAVKDINPRWRVRNYLTIGMMSFAKQIIFDDIDAEAWPKEADPLAAEPIRGIFGEQDSWDGAGPTEYEIDRIEASENPPLLILDADSSQQNAVIDALNGRSMVIQGPPGTGKSQTITNMIAALLAEGKTVLFMAEKMAALSVVKNRLDHAGLGDYILELHSKSSKQSILDSLRTRLEAPQPRSRDHDIAMTRAALTKTREKLNSYVQAMNAPAGQTGFAVHDVLWGHAARRDKLTSLPRAVADIAIEKPLSLTRADREAMEQAALTLESAAQVLGDHASPSRQPWRGIGRNDLTQFDLDEIERLASETIAAIDTLTLEAESFAGLAGWESVPKTIAGLRQEIGRIAGGLPRLEGDIDQNLLTRLRTPRAIKEAEAAASLVIQTRETAVRLEERGLAAFATVDLAVLRRCGQAMEGPGLSDPTLDGLEQAIERLRSSLPQDDECLTALERIASQFQIPELLRGELAGAMLLALERDIPSSSILQADDPVMHLDGCIDKLTRFERLHRDAHTAYSSIMTELAEDEVPTLAELRAAQRCIRETGFFGRLFSGTYKKAIKLALAIRPSLHGRNREDHLDCLEAAIDWRGAYADLQEFREIEAGIDLAARKARHDFTSLHAAAEWIAYLRKTIPFTLPGTTLLQTKLASLNEAEITALSALKSRHGQNLQRLVAIGRQNEPLSDVYRKAREAIGRLDACRHDLEAISWPRTRPLNSLAGDIIAIEQRQQALAGLAARPQPDDLLGDIWNGEATDLARLQATIAAATAIAHCDASIRERALADFALIARIRDAANHFAGTVRKADDAISTLSARLELTDEWVASAANPTEADLSVFRERLVAAIARLDLLVSQSALLVQETRAAEAGLGDIITAWRQADLSYAGLAGILDATWFRSAARLLVRQNPSLSNHVGSAHESDRQHFRKLDATLLELNAKALAARLHRNPIPPGVQTRSRRNYTDRVLIEHQCSLTRPSMNIRRLFDQGGRAVIAMKPCFMMSPMTVSNYLKPGVLSFDVCIIDEASQMRPEDALGAMFRARQVIVVGDKQQLPPTSFFDKQAAGAMTEEEEEEVIETSILELAERAWKPLRSLNWHYRSRHETLIDFSNQRFYDGRLIVFPSDKDASDEIGVSLVRVGGTYGSQVNPEEARAVVAAAIEHMTRYPERSLGIVAMNQQQANLIDSLMSEEFRTNPTATAYRDLWEAELEKFFVKNLESVQGDERDSIFVSTVFGRNEAGIQHNVFGPINGAGGYRRLNVLFSRAKYQTRVFTSLDPALIRDGRHNGSRILRDYLDFAASRKVPPVYDPAGAQPESPFEEWVLKRLAAMGYECVPQVGIKLDGKLDSYRIDIGIRHPDKAGRFILGLECDGATYHSARSARERDRLRQNVLENLGWKIHRIWSTDWFRDPDRELALVQRRIQTLASAD